jgi:hypothetical protein
VAGRSGGAEEERGASRGRGVWEGVVDIAEVPGDVSFCGARDHVL